MSTSAAYLHRLHHVARRPALYAPRQIPRAHVIQRRAMMSAWSNERGPSEQHLKSPPLADSPPTVVPTADSLSSDAASPQVAARPPPIPKAERPRPKIRSSKAALMITSNAVQRLQAMLHGPTPQLIRIGVRNKGCAGLSYHLDYVDKPDKFDEVVAQDGVRVLIDSKALFSIIGSEMDWKEDSLSSKFVFKNPNIKDACGCGESFTVGQ